MRTVIPGAQAASGRPISGAVIANGFVFVAGQSFVEFPDIEAQTAGVIDKIKGLLESPAATSRTPSAARCTCRT